MITKLFAPTGLKIDSAGTCTAAFSVFGNIDGDGDIVMPDAIENGAEIVVSAFNHASWNPGILPIGKGIIETPPSVPSSMPSSSTSPPRETPSRFYVGSAKCPAGLSDSIYWIPKT